MSGTAATETLAGAAMAALVVLPGALLARAPAIGVPALSLAFWVATASWPLEGRTRFLQAVLAASACLALLRLREARRPRRPRAHVLLLALACALPFLAHARLPVWPTPGAADTARAALLRTWHDGLPRTGSPLDAGGFGADRPGLPALAADLALVSGLAPHRAAARASALAASLAALAAFAMVAQVAGGPAGAAAALAACALASGIDASSVLAVAFSVAAAGLAAGSPTGQRAAASGLIAGAGILSDPWAAAAMLALLAASRRLRVASGARRWLLAGALLALAAWAWRLGSGGGGPLPWRALSMGAAALLWMGVEAGARAGARWPRVAPLLAAAAASAVWCLQPHPLSSTDVEALLSARDRTGALDALCRERSERSAWIEAIAGRRAADPAEGRCVPIDAVTSFHTPARNPASPKP